MYKTTIMNDFVLVILQAIGYNSNKMIHNLVFNMELQKRKILYKSLLNTAWFWSGARPAINKKQKYFMLPDHQLAENFILVFAL